MAKTCIWCERRPKENGRYVVVRRRADGMTEDLTPPSFNARTRVHEYGGGAVLIRDGVVYFSNFDDQKLYRLQAGEAVPQPIGQSPGCRYADAVLDAARQRIVCVREDHSGPGEAVNTIVALRADGSGPEAVLASANDLYSNPRLSPDGQQLGWLTWNHPHMPWVSTELWVAKLDAAGSGDCSAAPRRGFGHGITVPARMVTRRRVTGASAGGYTTLCGLVFGQGFFKIGASYYGVGDLETLVRDTHKFESRYLDWLVGKYPEEKATYIERSPIHFTDRLTVPVILLQGEEDKIVPPNQAELFADAVRRKGLPLGFLLFEKEQHGFRRAENI